MPDNQVKFNNILLVKGKENKIEKEQHSQVNAANEKVENSIGKIFPEV